MRRRKKRCVGVFVCGEEEGDEEKTRRRGVKEDCLVGCALAVRLGPAGAGG